MKKILTIILIILIISAIAGTCFILKKQKPDQPAQPIQTEQIKKPVQQNIKQPKTEVKEPKLLDENNMPKSDINVPEIG